MALIRQTDRRTGTVYVYEAEARWDPKRKQSRYGRRRLVGHVDPGTGEVVPDGADRGVNSVARLQAGVPRRVRAARRRGRRVGRRRRARARAAGDVGPGAVAGSPRGLRGLRPASLVERSNIN